MNLYGLCEKIWFIIITLQLLRAFSNDYKIFHMLCICENTASSLSLCIGWLTTDSWGCYETNWQPPPWTFYPSVFYNIHYLGDPTVVLYLGCASHSVVKTHSSCRCFCDSVSDSMGSHSVSKTASWGDRHRKRLDAADLRKILMFWTSDCLHHQMAQTVWLRSCDIIAFGTDVCLVYSHISIRIVSLFFLYIYLVYLMTDLMLMDDTVWQLSGKRRPLYCRSSRA